MTRSRSVTASAAINGLHCATGVLGFCKYQASATAAPRLAAHIDTILRCITRDQGARQPGPGGGVTVQTTTTLIQNTISMRAPEQKHINRLLCALYTERAATMTAIKIILRITIHYKVYRDPHFQTPCITLTAAGGGFGRDIGLISLLSHSAPSRTNNNQRSLHTTGYCHVRHKPSAWNYSERCSELLTECRGAVNTILSSVSKNI